MSKAEARLPVVNQVSGERFHASDLPAGRVPVLFTADWCGFCARFYPHFRRFQHGYVVDISDEDLPHWDDYAIRVVPTVILFEDGKPVKRWAGILGARDAEEVAAVLRP